MNSKFLQKDLITESIEKAERMLGDLQNNREEWTYIMAFLASHKVKADVEVIKSRIANYIKEKK